MSTYNTNIINQLLGTITPLNGISHQSMQYEKDEAIYVRRHNRSRSSSNKMSIHKERQPEISNFPIVYFTGKFLSIKKT